MTIGPLEILLGGAVVFPIAGLAWLAWAGFRQAEQAAATAARLARAVARAPDGLILRTGEPPRSRLSPSLAGRLETREEAGADAFLGRLGDAERAQLEEAFRRLVDNGIAIDRRVGEPGGRVWRVMGERHGEACFAWIRDITAQERTVEERASLQTLLDSREATLDSVPLPVWQRRQGDAAPDYRNRAAREIFGDGGAEERVSRTLSQRAQRSGSAQTESTSVVVGGRRRLMEIVEMPVSGTGIVGHARDVSQLAELQDELARHVAAHGEVLQKLTTAIAIYGRDRRLRLFNEAFADLWELDRRWLAGEPDFGAILELLRQRRRLPEYADFAQAKRQLLSLFTQLIEPVEEFLHLPDGRTIRQIVSPHPQGGLLFTFEDVSDRVAIERSYNTLIAVQRETLDSLNEGVAAFAGDGRLQLSNPAFGRLWKLDEPFLAERPHLNELGKRVRELVPDAGAAGLELTGEIRDHASGRIERLDGSVLDFARVALPDGATLLIYQDVTDSLRVERALRDRNEALETADRLKSEFIANVSYELRTPLNAIVGFAQMLAEQYFGPLNDRQLEHTRSIIGASDRLVSLINDILDLSSIEAGNLMLSPAEVPIDLLLSQVEGLSREAARQRELALAIDCPPDIGAIRADERRLKQALLNLVSNSAKFTPAGGGIVLSARRDADAVTLTVADTGVGIEPEHHAKIFEPFTRGRGSQAGAGLGLALVRRFVELHGGDVSVDSVPGEGTRVAIRLPA
jgi:signal transduction histidine kinase